jgi:RNA polymerase sigma factor (sigma-70 family)
MLSDEIVLRQTVTEPSDEQLLAAVQSGNLDAYETLDHRYRSRLTAYLLRRLDPSMREATDDLVQATLQYLFEKAALFIQPNTYVANILFNRAFRYMQNFRRDWFRQRRDRNRTLRFLDHESRGTDIDEYDEPCEPCDRVVQVIDLRGVEKEEARREVDDFLSLLTPAEAEIIRLIDLEGHTAKSAADILHVKLTTAQWCYRKAREHLERVAQRALA